MASNRRSSESLRDDHGTWLVDDEKLWKLCISCFSVFAFFARRPDQTTTIDERSRQKLRSVWVICHLPLHVGRRVNNCWWTGEQQHFPYLLRLDPWILTALPGALALSGWKDWHSVSSSSTVWSAMSSFKNAEKAHRRTHKERGQVSLQTVIWVRIIMLNLPVLQSQGHISTKIWTVGETQRLRAESEVRAPGDIFHSLVKRALTPCAFSVIRDYNAKQTKLRNLQQKVRANLFQYK